MKTITDESRELELYIVNDRELYRQQTQAIQNSLRKKFEKGVYDHQKAPKLWGYLVESGAKKYCLEFGSKCDKWFEMFPVSARKEAAQSLADSWKVEMELGN